MSKVDSPSNWQAEWAPVVAAVGKDFLDGEVTWGADPIEPGAIRRFLEPLEFDSGLHTDPATAEVHGFGNVIMPYTGILAWTIPEAWRPGERLFDSADRDAQPVHSHINNADLDIGPETTGFFGTDIEVDFHREVLAGERLGRRGKTLVDCVPKQTAVGKGAFMTWQSELIVDSGEVVGLLRIGTYAYIPHEKES